MVKDRISKMVFKYLDNCAWEMLKINDAKFLNIDGETIFELSNGCLNICPKLFFKIKQLFGVDEHQDIIDIFRDWLKSRHNITFNKYFMHVDITIKSPPLLIPM